MEEYIEAVSFLHYLENGTLISLKEVQDNLTDPETSQPVSTRFRARAFLSIAMLTVAVRVCDGRRLHPGHVGSHRRIDALCYKRYVPLVKCLRPATRLLTGSSIEYRRSRDPAGSLRLCPHSQVASVPSIRSEDMHLTTADFDNIPGHMLSAYMQKKLASKQEETTRSLLKIEKG